MSDEFTLLAPEVIGIKEQQLRASIKLTKEKCNMSLCQVTFKRKHTTLVFLYLVSRVRYWDGKSKILLNCSTKEIVEGIGCNPESNSIRTAVNHALNELHQTGVITLMSQPKRDENYPIQVVNHVVTPQLLEFAENKKHDHCIQINPNFVYDKSCKYYLPIPDDIISHKELNYSEKLVYIAILKFSWSTSAKSGSDFRPIKLETICEFLDLQDRTVKRATKKLEELGLIQKFMKTRKVDNLYQRIVKYIPLRLCLYNPSSEKLEVVTLDKFESNEVWENS